MEEPVACHIDRGLFLIRCCQDLIAPGIQTPGIRFTSKHFAVASAYELRDTEILIPCLSKRDRTDRDAVVRADLRELPASDKSLQHVVVRYAGIEFIDPALLSSGISRAVHHNLVAPLYELFIGKMQVLHFLACKECLYDTGCRRSPALQLLRPSVQSSGIGVPVEAELIQSAYEGFHFIGLIDIYGAV